MSNNGTTKVDLEAPPPYAAKQASRLPQLYVDEEEENKGHHDHKLNTFGGVFMPTCENMWGVIIFLRFYTICGHAGLGMSIVIITLSFLVALLTALSLSAIATCGTSHGLTGVYAMLARALGKELATATGLVYFLGIVFLSVLECLGACEELFHIFPSTKEYVRRPGMEDQREPSNPDGGPRAPAPTPSPACPAPRLRSRCSCGARSSCWAWWCSWAAASSSSPRSGCSPSAWRCSPSSASTSRSSPRRT